MELYDVFSEADKALRKAADNKKVPLGGTLELTPLCNMHCRMCYVVQTPEQLRRQGRLLEADKWLRIVDQGMEEGLLFLLLTGGEPLTYPGFQSLYSALSRRGLILSLNTNGTLLDERWADFFAEHGVRGISMTLYGKDNATYERLCGNPQGFTQIMRAARLLKERNLPYRFSCTVTPENVGELDEIFQIARDFGAPLQTCNYLFPAVRRGVDAESQMRLSPEDCAASTLACFQKMHPEAPVGVACTVTLDRLRHPPVIKNARGFTCHAGKSGFWINWRGDMTPCGMLPQPSTSLLTHSFHEAWTRTVAACDSVSLSPKCKSCEKQNLCHYCPAAAYAETGDVSGCPDYLCRMTDESLRLLREQAETVKDKVKIISAPPGASR